MDKVPISHALAAACKTIPKPKLPWRQCDPLTRSRFKEARGVWRRKKEAKKYKALALRIRRLRRNMSMTQNDFSKTVGVSSITVRRWEGALGFSPNPRHWKRIKELEKMSKELRKQGVEIDPKQFR